MVMASEDSGSESKPSVTLTPSGLGQYIGFSGCPRFFRLNYFDRHIVNQRNWYDDDTGDNLFAELGLAFEKEQLATLAATADSIVGDETSDGEAVSYDETWNTLSGEADTNTADQWNNCVRDQLTDIIESVAAREPSATDGPVVLFQIPMHGEIGVWDISGIADLIVVEPLSDTYGIQSRILEVKTSWKEKTSHQIQSTIYSQLLDNLVKPLDMEHRQKASVLNRECDLTQTSIAEIPEIDLSSRTAEIKRLLKRDGELHDLAKQSFDDVGYRLERKCDGCPYNGICFTKAIESADPALLSLTQGNQEQLSEHGINSLQGLTELYEREEGTRAYDFEELEVRNEEVVRGLETDGTMANRLEELTQRAQLLRGEIDPSYEQFDDIEYLRGTGNGILPDDDPPPNLPGVAGERNELIRVYLYVQHDHVRDRLALLAGRVDSNQTSPKQIVEFSDSLPTGQEESLQIEGDLLEAFLNRLFSVIREVQSKIDTGSQGYVHLYTYSGQERDALMEAVQRQPSVFGTSAVRDLLGLREGIDQPMISVVHNDITDRLALRYPGTGLIQTVDQMEAYAGGSYSKWRFTHDDWSAEIDGDTVDLTDVFETGLFEGKRAYVENSESIRLLLGDDTDPEREPDGFYPLYNRFGNQIPLEYLWAARGKIDEISDDAQSVGFAPYRYYDGPGSDLIGPQEIGALATRLTEALQHVERSIDQKNWKIDKQPIDVGQLPDFSLTDVELDTACQEYLDLEHATERQDCLEHYLMPPRKRMQSGNSTIFRVTAVEEAGDWDFRVKGELLYDELFRDPDRVIDSCRLSGEEQGGSGDWCVLSKIEDTGEGLSHTNITYPSAIARSATATVRKFDRINRTLTITVSKNGGWGQKRYISNHNDATMDFVEAEGDQYTTLVSEGDLFILDPYSDSYTKAYAYRALERTDSNALYSQLNQAFVTGTASQFDQTFCSADAIDEFIESFEAVTGSAPRGNQAEFVKCVEKSIAVLQGPPGTGKTSYTLSPSVLGRLFAAEADSERLVTVVTAPSHTAVDEAMADIVESWHRYTSNGGDLAPVAFARINSRDTDKYSDIVSSAVDFIDYYNTSHVDSITNHLAPHINSGDAVPTEHVVLFSTPTSLRGLVDKCAGGLFGLDSAKAVMDAGISFVDLLAIDEASMIDLPTSLLSSAFLRENGQTLLIGDHRQMEPVQKHEWGGEDRRTIEENVPFMSALNFVRFLRGDLIESEFAFAESPKLGDSIPITRLDKTYRLHERVADLLTDLVYTDDGIALKSDETDLLDGVAPSTRGVAAAMAPDEPVTLIIHGENESQDANRTEVGIIEGLIDALESPTNDDTGIVTPHNAQKGRLTQRFGDTATIDTVERFQGGERDVMMISATASDPDYVRSEAEFLLDPNRLNVAMSRMKKKLVIVASKSVFQVTPPDADEFDKTLIWKRLYDALGITADSPKTTAWEGTLSEFIPESVNLPDSDRDYEMEIYSLSAKSEE